MIQQLLLDIYLKELKLDSPRVVCKPMCTAALFTMAKMWKRPKYPWTDNHINKMCSPHRMKCHSDSKRRKILTHAWMNLEDRPSEKVERPDTQGRHLRSLPKST